eukprot:g16207.t2
MAVASMELSEEIVVPPPPESPWGTLVGVAGLPGGQERWEDELVSGGRFCSVLWFLSMGTSFSSSPSCSVPLQENWSIGAFFRAEVADAKGADPPVEEATLPEAEHHDQSSIYEEEVATLCPDSLDPKPEEGLVPSELKGEGSEVAPPQSEDAEDYSVPPEAPPSKPNKAATRGPSGKRARWWSFAWRRDGRALDLPGKETGALGLHPIRSELPPGCAVYDLLATDVGTTQLRRADGIVVLGQELPVPFEGLEIFEDVVSEDMERQILQSLQSWPWQPSQSGRWKQDFGPKANFKKQQEGPGESPQAEEIGEEMSRLKMPSGSAAAVVAARRSEDVNYVQQGVQESEDFVPELLTPQPSRRGRSLFGWRRKREELGLRGEG